MTKESATEYAAVYDAAADRWEARYTVAQPGYPETGYGSTQEQAIANLLEPMPLYNVVRRDSTQRSPVTDKPTFRAYGSTTADLRRALVEADARNLLLGEAEADRWEVVDESDNPIDPTEIAAAADTMEPGDVADFLVEVFGLSQAEADRLVS